MHNYLFCNIIEKSAALHLQTTLFFHQQLFYDMRIKIKGVDPVCCENIVVVQVKHHFAVFHNKWMNIM